MYKNKMLSDFELHNPSLYSVIFFFFLFLLQFHFSNGQANYSYFDYDEGYAYKKQYQLPTTFVPSYSMKNEDDLLHQIDVVVLVLDLESLTTLGSIEKGDIVLVPLGPVS